METIYFVCQNCGATIYYKCDLSNPKLIDCDDEPFNVYPTEAVAFYDDEVVYEEGSSEDDIENIVEDSFLTRLNDAKDEDASYITEEEFNNVKAKALAWIEENNRVKAHHGALLKEFKK